MNENNYVLKEKSRPVSPSCQVNVTFNQTLDNVFHQVEFLCFKINEQDFARELCFYIAEIYKLKNDYTVNIDGEPLPAELVKEIFEKITHDHMKLVIKNYKNSVNTVVRKKSYLRTALYNSVFELEAHYINTDYESL